MGDAGSDGVDFVERESRERDIDGGGSKSRVVRSARDVDDA
jgi:hypothetical protein